MPPYIWCGCFHFISSALKIVISFHLFYAIFFKIPFEYVCFRTRLKNRIFAKKKEVNSCLYYIFETYRVSKFACSLYAAIISFGLFGDVFVWKFRFCSSIKYVSMLLLSLLCFPRFSHILKFCSVSLSLYHCLSLSLYFFHRILCENIIIRNRYSSKKIHIYQSIVSIIILCVVRNQFYISEAGVCAFEFDSNIFVSHIFSFDFSLKWKITWRGFFWKW